MLMRWFEKRKQKKQEQEDCRKQRQTFLAEQRRKEFSEKVDYKQECINEAEAMNKFVAKGDAFIHCDERFVCTGVTSAKTIFDFSLEDINLSSYSYVKVGDNGELKGPITRDKTDLSPRIYADHFNVVTGKIEQVEFDYKYLAVLKAQNPVD